MRTTSQQGFVLFVALLTASLLLAVGLAVINLSLKGFTLSTDARESQFAFYAADSGAECALYWDLKTNIFTDGGQVRCNQYDEDQVNTPLAVENRENIGAGDAAGGEGASIDTYFWPASYCVRVKVFKEIVAGVTRTRIESRGYNVGDMSISGGIVNGGANCLGVSDQRRVERMIEVTY